MTFTVAVIAHVIVGLVGIIATYAVALGTRKKTPSVVFLIWTSATAFVSFILSWAFGAYYYVLNYGANVKPVILAGKYPWAHSIFMEAKEHVFLFLPFLAFVTMLAVLLFRENIATDDRLRNSVFFLAMTTFLLGVFITLSGVLISGAVR